MWTIINGWLNVIALFFQKQMADTEATKKAIEQKEKDLKDALKKGDVAAVNDILSR